VTRLLSLLMMLTATMITVHAETVEIGAEDDWYPYSGVVDGKPRGFAEDIVQAAFNAVGVDVKYKSLPYARCMAETRAGTLLGCFDAARNSLLEANYLWHAQPLYNARINIYARVTSRDVGLTVKSLEGRVVGVTNNYEYGEAFDTDRQIIRDVSNQDVQGFRKLLLGRVEYMVAYAKVANYLFESYKSEFQGRFKVVGTTGEPGLYLAFSRQYPSAERFVGLFNEGLETIHKDGRYAALEAKWH